MTLLRTPRFWLMTTAALIVSNGAQLQAHAQTSYQTGGSAIVSAAQGFPSIPAEQIASDVREEVNPRTGQTELYAAPFDPFEEDPTLAGSVNLRSTNGAVAIDGRQLVDGVILEADFYYNSPSDDPYEGRGFSDASFINGELAPVVMRDTRVLECSSRVENVVYNHNAYYGRPIARGLYRPYRHYAGHYGFGFGFGNSYFGPGYGFYSRNHSRVGSRGYSSRRYTTSRHRNTDNRGATNGNNRNYTRGDDRHDRSGDRDTRRDSDRSSTRGNNVSSRGNGTAQRDTQRTSTRNRLNRVQSYDGNTQRNTRAATSGNRQSGNRAMRGVNSQRIEAAPSNAQSGNRSSARTSAPRANNVSAQSASSKPQKTQTRQVSVQRSKPQRETSKSETSSRSTQSRSSTRSNRSTSSRSSSSRSTSVRSNGKRRQLNFFPRDSYGYGGRTVVTSQSVDCAREDKLQVFIPTARLEAARFDGLSVIALDSQGGETPIYIPPNYIEGYILAASGRIRPQGYQAAPVPVQPQYSPQPVTPQPYSQPSRVIESAPCPAGTAKQPDGTCLQGGSISGATGYPTR